MKKSKILQKDHEGIIRLHKQMTPEERLVAHFYHSYLMHKIHQAGEKYRAAQ